MLGFKLGFKLGLSRSIARGVQIRGSSLNEDCTVRSRVRVG